MPDPSCTSGTESEVPKLPDGWIPAVQQPAKNHKGSEENYNLRIQRKVRPILGYSS